jgi:hypothetical protein
LARSAAVDPASDPEAQRLAARLAGDLMRLREHLRLVAAPKARQDQTSPADQ